MRSRFSFSILLVVAFVAALVLPKVRADIVLPSGFMEVPVGTTWTEPVGIAFDPVDADRAYVWEKRGMVWVVEAGVKSDTPLIDLSDEVGNWRDHGLLGFALHPDFRQNGYIYLLYVVDRHHLLKAGTAEYNPATDEYYNATIARVTRYTARASDGFTSVDPASRTVLIGETKSAGFPITFESHGVGSLVFANDGTLLISCGESASYQGVDDGGGDGGAYSAQALSDGILQPKEDVGAFRAQLVDSLSGKILRIDPLSGDGVPSNPFYDSSAPRAARSRVWTVGVRNPFRMTVRPGTGSHNPADGDPGVILFGDVGWNTWEELNVVTGPGQNCGWPLFEGLTAQSNYLESPAQNLDAPNPLGGYFKFKDLLIQDTLATPSWPNPTDPTKQIPSSIPRFVHRRPVIEVGRNTPIGPARTGIFNGTTAAEVNIGAEGSPVSGPQFIGLSAIGGTFYTGTDFPAAYQGTYFYADFDQGWIRNVTFDANHRPVQEQDFATSVFKPVFMTTHPTNGSLYYVSVGNFIRQIIYAPGGNRPPVAAVAVDQAVGASPLTVHFSSAGSSDPDGQPLSYLWDFGDGTTSTEADPTKTFTATGTKRFDVTLTVTDAGNATGQATTAVFVNHALPVVNITSPLDGAKYSLTTDENFALLRSVTEVTGHPTTTTWQVILHHNNHEHTESPVTADSTTAVISPAYSAGAIFYYRILLTVTDDLGASVQKEVRLYPNLSNVAPVLSWSTATMNGTADAALAIFDSSASISDSDSVQFDFGRLTVASSGGVGDNLAIVSEGNGPGQVSVTGGDVSYGGVPVGTVTGGAAGQPLVVDFNSIATPATTQAILRRVGGSFHLSGTHAITATVNDGDGDASTAAVLNVQVSGGPPNQPPTVSLTSPTDLASYVKPATIPLMATANDTDGDVVRVEFYSGATKLGEVSAAPYTFTWSDVMPGTYVLTAVATDDFGAHITSAAVNVTVNPDNVLPPQWHPSDVGAVAAAGSIGYADGAYTLGGSGAGIGSLKDEFFFLSQPWTGDGEIIARVASVENVSPKSFAGLMFRDTASPTARFALVKLSAAQGICLQTRSAVGTAAITATGPSVGAPRWLRLVRHGLRCTAYSSIDGMQWQQVASAAAPMAKTLQVGLVASSMVDGQVASVVFDHVTVNSLTSPSAPTVALSSPSDGASFTAPANIAIDARANDVDGGIARVELYSGSTKVAIDTRAPFAFTWPSVRAGSYSLTAKAYDFSGLNTTSAPVSLTVNAAVNSLPAPWNSRDLGASRQGGAAVQTDGTYTLTSTGLGLGSVTDQGRIVYRPWTGNGTITARVASLADTSPAAFAGITFRETLATNARHATVGVTAEQGCQFAYRSVPAGKAAQLAGPAIMAPQWLKLVRSGTKFSAFTSADGVTWNSVGTRTLPIATQCYVGFIVGAADPVEETAAVFDQVSCTKP